MTFTSRRERVRAILAGSRCVHPGSVYDAISARIAEEVGFEVGLVGGSAISLAILGAPDIALITLSELAEQCRRICRACTLPIVVDADHGYGNALSVMRTVEELESVGVAALTIEDIVLPRPYGTPETIPPISEEEMVGKLRAAVRARLDPSLVVIGRMTGLRSLGVEDTLRRIPAYEATGIDAIMIVGSKSLKEIEAVCSVATLPVVVGGAPKEPGVSEALAKIGVRLSMQGHAPPLAATYAIMEAQKAAFAGVPLGKIPNLADAALMAKVTREADYERWTQELLGGK